MSDPIKRLRVIAADEALQHEIRAHYPKGGRGIAVNKDANAREWQRLEYRRDDRLDEAMKCLPALLDVAEAAQEVVRCQNDMAVPDYIESRSWEKLGEALAKLGASHG